jgi:hypothetical protein
MSATSKPVINMVHVLISKAFLKFHAVLIALVYLVMFGSVSGNQIISYHKSLIAALIHSSVLLGIYILFWTLYTCRVIYFCKNQTQHVQNSFLYLLQLLPVKDIYKIAWRNTITMFLPISFYGLLILLYCAYYHYINMFIGIFIMMIVFHWIAVWFFIRFIKNQEQLFLTSNLFKKFNVKLIFPFQVFYKYLINRQLYSFLLQKCIGLGTIVLVFYSRTPADEIRLPIMLYALALLCHTSLLNNIALWDEDTLRIHRKMPIRVLHFYLNYLFLIVFITLPETVLIVKSIYTHNTMYEAVGLVFFGISFLLLIISICYSQQLQLKEAYNGIMISLVFIYVAALAEALFILGIVLLVVSLVVFYIYYPKFEVMQHEN